MRKHLTLHGHFYQPPRENPWTESIDRQASAQPEHDWNEKISAECYYPNGFSRILDANGRITEIVNNYRYLNFNFGPTLLSWLELHAPDVYQRILQADRESLQRYEGHGSAIAQCYSHMIMPLATLEDQRLQIQWGIADFQHRFQRAPESIWLPETAINQQTLNILTEFDFSYLILSPHQAQRIRPLDHAGDEGWHEVGHGEIDTSRAYRCFATDENGEKLADRFLDIFFYNDDLSRGISFENLLQDAHNLADRIESNFDGAEGDQLVGTATDGETFGHHQKFGDMAIAYLLHVEAAQRHIQPINYAAYLAKNPPMHEVVLKPGPNGEGTAWSCAHGLGRWYRDCGCNAGGGFNWNQTWRTPLRLALDALRDNLLKVAETVGPEICSDYRAAREDYIHVILDRAEETGERDRFLERHLRNTGDENARMRGLKLMEMLRHSQLMYTSCGWFFSELSGIETVQVLKYAARAIQLAQELTGDDLEPAFIEDLKKAKSNITKFRDGAWIYRHSVKNDVVSFARVANHFAIWSLFDPDSAAAEQKRVYIYDIRQEDRHAGGNGDLHLLVGRLRVQSRITLETADFAYALFHREGAGDLRCCVHPMAEAWDYENAKQAAIAAVEQHPETAEEHIQPIWGDAQFSVADLFFDERQKVVDTILQKKLQDVSDHYKAIFKRSRGLITTISQLDLPLPQEVVVPARVTLSEVINREVRKLADTTDHSEFSEGLEAAQTADKLDIALDTREAARFCQRIIEDRLRALPDEFTPTRVDELASAIELGQRFRLKLHKAPIQNHLYTILNTRVMPAIADMLENGHNPETVAAIDTLLRVAYYFNFNVKIYKDRLRPLEAATRQYSKSWP